MNKCHKARRLLALRAADRSPNEQAYLEAHLQDCPHCAAWAQQYREQDALIGTLPRVRPSLSQEQRFLANIHNERGHIAMFGRLTRIISAAAFVAVLVLLGIITRALLPTTLPDQDRSPASSGEATTPINEEKEYILYDDDGGLFAMDVANGETSLLLYPSIGGAHFTEVSCASAVEHIVFTEYAEGDVEIAVMDLHTREVTRLPNAMAADSTDPALSPDGRRIAFISNRPGNNELYIMQTDGSELTQLTDLQSGVFYPSWSPDGTQIVFSLDGGDNTYLYVVDADGNNLRQVTESPGIVADPAWSPDGDSIAFTLLTDKAVTIYTIAPDGSNLKRMIEPESVDGTPVAYFSSAWSPDGTRLAYVRAGVGDSELYVMDIATTESVSIPITTSDVWGPCWMRSSIELVPAPESIEPNPTATLAFPPTTPTPIPTPGAPDSLLIVYTHSDGGLWLTNGPGTDRKLTSGEMDVSPVFSADGRKVLFRRYFPSEGSILDKWDICVTDIVHGPEICLIDTDAFTTTDPTLRRLPYVEKWLADNRTLAFTTMLEPKGGGMGYNGYKNIGLVDVENSNHLFVWDTQEAVDDHNIIPSTDMNYIAFASNNEIAVVSLAQQDLAFRHTFEKASVPPASIPVVAWAEDNASVLAAVYSPDQTPQSLTMDLWQIELEGDAIQFGTGLPPMRNSYGQWSPDKQSFAYTTLGSGDVKPGDLYVISRKNLTLTPYNTESIFLGWNPNNEQFTFAMPESNKFYWHSELYLGQLGSEPVPIVSSDVSGNGVLFIDWVDEESFVYKVNLGESGYEIRLGHIDGSYQLMTTVAPGIATDRNIAVYPGNRE